MTFKDRTNEFSSIVESAQSPKQGASKGGMNSDGSFTPTVPLLSKSSSFGASTKAKTPAQVKTEFGLIAAQIGRDIAETSGKLEKLTKLAKKKSLFDDNSTEIQDLTAIVNQDIKNLNNQIAVLQQQQKMMGKTKQAETHSITVVDSLKKKLRNTTKEFTEVLEQRTENLKVQQKERESLTGTYSPMSRRHAASPLYKALNSYDQDSERDGASAVAVPMPRMALMTQERYLNTRAEAVVSIERTIAELQTIFGQLASLIAEQGEMIERIDNDVENVSLNVSTAQNELMRYLSSVGSNRWLIIKVFGILFLFIIVFVMFFV